MAGKGVKERLTKPDPLSAPLVHILKRTFHFRQAVEDRQLYGIPNNFDCSIFVGRVLELISFAAYTVHFSFNEDLSITIESSFAHGIDADDSITKQVIPVRESAVMQLIGKTVETAAVEDVGTLVLYFESGQILKCFDDSPQYESYKITNRGDETIV